MAKTKEPKALKKGKASFNLIGRVKRTDKSFNLNNTYDSGWTDNSMYIGVDCGNGNVVYSEMRSGFFPDNESTIRAYSKDDKDENGKSKSVEIAWEDRLDESILDTVADTSLITVGVEKDVHGKTVYKKFLQAYDAVEYLDEYLEDNVVVNVKGNLGYSEYDGNVSVKKDITSIVLSKVEDENDFKATFSQTILIEPKCIGKTLEEKGTIELDAYVVDYVGKPKVDGKKVEVKKNVVFPKTFEIEVNENPEITAKMIKRFFDPKKKGQVNEITVAGKLVEGGTTVTITKDDIPDDIKELIEMGIYSEDEAVKKIAVGGGNRERRMIVVKPDIVYVEQGDDRKPSVAFEEGKYEEDDLIFYEQALLAAGDGNEDTDSDVDSSEMTDEDDELVKMLADMA